VAEYFLQQGYIDFHTHLDWYKEGELFSQLATFQGTIIAASVDVASYQKNLYLAEKAKSLGLNASIVPTFGVHPAKVLEVLSKSADLQTLDSYCNSSAIIGEIGMDLCWYKDAPEEMQQKVFEYFLDHCNRTKKYCVIHTKDAEKQIAELLLKYPDAKPIIHWYDGPEDIYQEFIKRGYYVTFGCQTCRSEYLQKLLKHTPLNLILPETDNPDSEPWLGGTDSSIHLIKRIYSDIGSVIDYKPDEIQNLLNKNALKILEDTVRKFP